MNEKIVIKKLASGDLYLDASMLDEIVGDSETLSSWLMDEVGKQDVILKYIDDVINEEVAEDEIGINGFIAYIKKDITDIHFIFEDEDSRIKPCYLPTKLLREIVEIWLKNVK